MVSRWGRDALCVLVCGRKWRQKREIRREQGGGRRDSSRFGFAWLSTVFGDRLADCSLGLQPVDHAISGVQPVEDETWDHAPIEADRLAGVRPR